MHALLAPLDRTRALALRALVRVPRLGRWVSRREPRATLRAITATVFALVLAWVAPALALALGPIVFGVPHAASSTRYLVLRGGGTRARLAGVALVSTAIVLTRVAEQRGGAVHAFARVEIGLGVVLAAAAVLAAARDGRPRRALAAGVVALAAGALALAHPLAARLALVHVHNLGVLAIWAMAFRRRAAAAAWPIGLVAAAIAALALGVHLGLAPTSSRALGVDVAEVGAWLAPGASPRVASALVLAHAFTDSVHYAFWLGVVPEETLRVEGSPTFRMTARSLRRDFGAPALAAVVVVACAVALVAVCDLGLARRAYFVLAGFHGHVEGAALLYLLARGGPRDATRTEPWVDHPPSRMQMRPTNAMSAHLGSAPAQSAGVTHSSVQ